MNTPSTRLIIVSNRLPFVLTKDKDEWSIKQGSGGLVTAMVPVLKNRGGIWVGWMGIIEDDNDDKDKVIAETTKGLGYDLVQVSLTKEDVDGFYYGYSNEIIWPLFHDFPSFCNFKPAYWHTYQSVNLKYAQQVFSVAKDGDFIWIQDYQLICVASELRKLGMTQNIGFFLHIPFPPLDLFLKLPQRFSILESLLSYNLIGFQTMRDKRNFMECLRLLMPHAKIRGKKNLQTVEVDSKAVFVGAFPISIDYKDFVKRASLPQVISKSNQIHSDLPNRELILGIDRLDYSKGLTYRLKAFAYMLEKYPELIGQITFIQVVVPSREDIPGYHKLKEQIEMLVGEINGRFTRSGWVPVHYIYRSLTQTELISYYRASRIAFVTPLKDGMNLVAKEFCACSIDKNCALILSEFAGAAAELQNGAILVNPFDIEGMSDALYYAITMDALERKARMVKLRAKIRDHTIYDWIDGYLSALASKTLGDFPIVDDYMPTSDSPSTDIFADGE